MFESRPDRHRPGARRRDLAVVEHRVDQELNATGSSPRSRASKRQPGGQAAPGAGTADADPSWRRRRARRRGREPTPDRRNSRRVEPGTGAPVRAGTRPTRPTQRKVGHQRSKRRSSPDVAAEHVAAAVDPVHARQASLDADRPVHAHRHPCRIVDHVIGTSHIVGQRFDRPLRHHGAHVVDVVQRQPAQQHAEIDRRGIEHLGDLAVDQRSHVDTCSHRRRCSQERAGAGEPVEPARPRHTSRQVTSVQVRSPEIEPVEVHDLVPRRDEVTHELLASRRPTRRPRRAPAAASSSRRRGRPRWPST